MAKGMLSKMNDVYQEKIGQPFVRSPVGQALSGYLGIAPSGTVTEPYKFGQGLGNIPGLNAPGGIFKAAVNSPEIAQGVLVGIKGLANLRKSNPELWAKQQDALKQAKQADELGVFETPVESANMYGWFKDSDGHWKTWISDEGTKFGDLTKSGMLGEKFQHPRLYDWYPDMKDQNYVADYNTPARGYVSPPEYNADGKFIAAINPIRANTGPVREGVMFHEAGAHVPQHMEGWSPGGSSAMFADLKGQMQAKGYVASEAQTRAMIAGDLINLTGGQLPKEGTKEWRIAMEKLADLHTRNPERYPALSLSQSNGSTMSVLIDRYMHDIRTAFEHNRKGPELQREGMIAKVQKDRAARGAEYLDQTAPDDYTAYRNLHGEYRAVQPQKFWEMGITDPTPEMYTHTPGGTLRMEKILEELERNTGVPRGTYDRYVVGVTRK